MERDQKEEARAGLVLAFQHSWASVLVLELSSGEREVGECVYKDGQLMVWVSRKPVPALVQDLCEQEEEGVSSSAALFGEEESLPWEPEMVLLTLPATIYTINKPLLITADDS